CRRRHTMFSRDWSSDVCSSDLSSGLLQGLSRGVRMNSQGFSQRILGNPFVGGFLGPPHEPEMRTEHRYHENRAHSTGNQFLHLRSEERRVGNKRRTTWASVYLP